MDQLKRMAIFAAVVERGSMRGAARQLGLTPSAVSQQMRALEQATGVTLLHRSTRKLTLTDAGARYHAGCAAMVAAARQADEALAMLRDAPEGELRLAAPVGFASLIAQALGPLLTAYPALNLHLVLDDAPSDLIGERIDLALRVGRWPDSSLVARRLGSLEAVVVATPAYVARHGAPRTPEELASLDWLVMSSGGAPRPITLLDRDDRPFALRPRARVASTNHLALQRLCLAGLGVAQLVRADIAPELREGRLVPLLPAWRSPPMGVFAVTPRRDAQPASVRRALQALQATLDTASESAHAEVTGDESTYAKPGTAVKANADIIESAPATLPGGDGGLER